MNEATQGITNSDGSVFRRLWTKEQKRKIAEESFQRDTSVSIVARQYDVNTNQVFKWRQEYLRGDFGKPRISASSEFLQIGVIGHDGRMSPPTEKPAPAPLPPPAAPPAPRRTNSPQGIIEIVLHQGVRVRCKGDVDLSVLSHVITTAARLS